MRKSLPVTMVLFLIVPSLLVEAQEKIGETVYLDGDVSLTRNGEALDPSEVTIGLPIENFDLMQTGDDGDAQVRITTTGAPSSTITVSADTQFTFELSSLQGSQSSLINLISGSISLKVSKLGASQTMDVQTESASFGIRGTDFTVAASEAGDVLVTCSTGAVSCRTQSGLEYRAVPGTVVQSQEGGAFRTVPVAPSELESYRRSWAQERQAAIRANAFGLIRTNAARYEQLRAAYDRDYAILMRQQSVISTWQAEDRRGIIGSAPDAERQKATVAATMLRLRRTQFLLERVQYRLQRLKALHDQGYWEAPSP